MPHAIWRGSISFGLVSIPVSLLPAVRQRELAFHLLDARDMAQVHNKRVNAATGEEVPWEQVVKGLQVEEGRWVVVTDDDMRAANVEATQTIDVLAAVCASEIAPQYYDQPYYLSPEKAGRKAYALLRDTLKAEGRVAVGKVVIRTRQHLAVIVPEGDALLLEVLRYQYELRGTEDLDLPATGTAKTDGSDAEATLARQLVEAISKPFDANAPEYRDTYHDDLLELLAKKAKGATVTPAAPAGEEPQAEVVDIVALLKRSLEDAKKARG